MPEVSLLHHILDCDLSAEVPGEWVIRVVPPSRPSPCNVSFARRIETIGELNGLLVSLAEIAPIPEERKKKRKIEPWDLRERDFLSQPLKEVEEDIIQAKEIREIGATPPNLLQYFHKPEPVRRDGVISLLDEWARKMRNANAAHMILYLEITDLVELNNPRYLYNICYRLSSKHQITLQSRHMYGNRYFVYRVPKGYQKKQERRRPGRPRKYDKI